MSLHARTLIVWVALASLAATGGHAEPERVVAVDWGVLEGAELSILHHADDLRYAERVLSIYDARADEIAASMGLKTLSPLRVIVAPSVSEFSELTHGGVPDWGVGCALVDRGIIVLKSPRVVSYPLQMETVVEHELAHVAAGRVLRGIDVPRWFHEGVAQTVAGEWRMGSSGSLAGRAAVGDLPSLRSLRESFPADREDAAVAYALSFRAVGFLMDIARAESPGEVVLAVRDAGDFASALERLTGAGEGEFERRFTVALSRRLSRSLLLRDGRLVFVAGAVLVILAVVVRARHRRGVMRRWDDEDATRKRVVRGGGDDARWQ